MMPLLSLCIAVPILAILCWSDCRCRRLPNSWTLGLAVVGLVWRLVSGGFSGIVDGVSGGLICGLFLLIPYLTKGAGGGDLKMIAAAGIFTGLRYCCAELLFVSLAGLLLGLIMLICGRVKSTRLKHWLGAAALPDKSDETIRIPFGVAIAAGTVVTLIYAYIMEKPL